MKQIITSILDNDLYKFTMLNAILKLYPTDIVEYKFHNRANVKFPSWFGNTLREQIGLMETISLTQTEEMYLREHFSSIFDEHFFDYLRNFRYKSDQISIKESHGELSLVIKGTWAETILWEVPLMALISEQYFQNSKVTPDFLKFVNSTKLKGNVILKQNLDVIEFGTRRRFSRLSQMVALNTLKTSSKNRILGTSNLLMGMFLGLKVFGTQAHEWTMFHGAIHSYSQANIQAVKAWLSIYNKPTLLLPDTYTSKLFFESALKTDIGRDFCNGFRQDSGDPFIFTNLVLDYHKELNIISEFEEIMYSDNLNMSKILEISKYKQGSIKKYYGVGTNFTNDFEGITPLNMVIKLDKVNGKSVCKLSDDLGKNTGDSEEVLKCKKELGLWTE